MGYTGVRYEIKQGDTLWDIAARKLGDPGAWPRIYAFNNQTDVIAAGARRISDPDVIYAGSVLMLPIPPGPQQRPAPTAKAGQPNLKAQIPTISMPVRFAYDIDDAPITLDYGTFIARIRQKARVLIEPAAKTPLTVVLNGSFEMNAKVEAKNAFTTLVSENKIKFDPATRKITFSNKLISSATNIPGPKTEVGLEISNTSGIPVLKSTIVYPMVVGKFAGGGFVALDYKIEIEIEPRIPPLTPQPVRVANHLPVQRTDWARVAREARPGALIVAGVITVAFGMSVVFTGGTSTVGAPAYASVMAMILVGATATKMAVPN